MRGRRWRGERATTSSVMIACTCLCNHGRARKEREPMELRFHTWISFPVLRTDLSFSILPKILRDDQHFPSGLLRTLFKVIACRSVFIGLLLPSRLRLPLFHRVPALP